MVGSSVEHSVDLWAQQMAARKADWMAEKSVAAKAGKKAANLADPWVEQKVARLAEK